MNEPSTTYHDRLRQELVAASGRLYHQYQGAQGDRPRRTMPQRRVRFAVGGTLGLALAAGIAALIIGLGAGAQPAAAEWSRWTATPTPPAEGQTPAAEEACLAQTLGLRVHSLIGSQPGPWQVLVADTRGPFTLVLLQSANHNAIASCLATSSTADITSVGGGYRGGKPPTVPAEQIKMEQFGQDRFAPQTPPEPGHVVTTAAELGHPYSNVVGQAGTGVSAISLVLSDGQHVTPTITNGWFLAWWPTWVHVVAAEVTTPQGTSTQQLYNPLNESVSESAPSPDQVGRAK